MGVALRVGTSGKDVEKKRIAYIRKRNYCVSFLRKTKKKYYANFNQKKSTLMVAWEYGTIIGKNFKYSLEKNFEIQEPF